MRRLYFALVMFGLMFFIGGCGGGGSPIPCTPSEIGIAGNLSPSNYQLVGLSPSLTWEYPSSSPSPYPYPTG